ncbi:hypothetical protein HYX14_00350 [Candidatus Woesearchaeota archaeon]|nr:hypothetical protein [Candidatus Woesearchaeota archaeon]
MIYRDRKGNEYDIGKFSEDETKLWEWLQKEYDSAPSWWYFKDSTGFSIICEAKRRYGADWQKFPLYQIHLDLIENIAIRSGEARGELSDMLVEK